MTTTGKMDIIKQLLADKPSFHLSGEARWDAQPSTLQAIKESVDSGDTTFEIGVGASTVVFAASGAVHTAVSSDPVEHERVRSYCQQIGIDDSRLTFVTGFSDDALPSLLGRDRTLDVALIDGAHSFPIPIIDWYYITRALKVSGKLLLDDIPVPVVAQVFRHMNLEPNWRLDGIFDNRAAAFTLIALPEPGDDWIRQPFNASYPDYSFVGMPKRVSLAAKYKFIQLRHRTGQRYPSLRRFYKRLV